MNTKIEELKKAKDNVQWLLDNPTGQVDFHSLTYWASVVERLRKEISESL